MLNDIKLTTLSPATTGKSEPSSRPLVKENSQEPVSDVTLTPHLGKLASALSESNETHCSERSDKIATLKTLLHNDEYKVDMKTLAKRLSECTLLN